MLVFSRRGSYDLIYDTDRQHYSGVTQCKKNHFNLRLLILVNDQKCKMYIYGRDSDGRYAVSYMYM